MRTVRLTKESTKDILENLLKRSPNNYGKFEAAVADILANVKEKGDEALFSYTKEFDKYLKENNLQGHLRSNSIIMCQMIFTSDQTFFDRIGEQETKRYFDECYKFICYYKNLGEKNIISAVVHLDEGAPHMHLMFVPVVHTKDKEGKDIDKICARCIFQSC